MKKKARFTKLKKKPVVQRLNIVDDLILSAGLMICRALIFEFSDSDAPEADMPIQTEDAEFEIIKPKQLTNDNKP